MKIKTPKRLNPDRQEIDDYFDKRKEEDSSKENNPIKKGRKALNRLRSRQ